MAAVANTASAMPPHQPRRFSASEPAHHHRRMSVMAKKDSHFGPALTPLFMGISAVKLDENTVVVALAAHDTVYLLDYAVKHINLDGQGDNDNDIVADHILDDVHKYERDHFVKFIGVGISQATHALSPTLCSRLWLDADIVPIVLAPVDEQQRVQGKKSLWDVKRVDEQADSMARRCILNFGPSHAPLLQVGFRGVVQSDAAFKAHLTRLEDHRNTCGASTWDAVMHYAERLKGKKTKIAFFSSTPQGGGVALMRHALVRFSRLAGVDLSWYVPKPRPGVFRITKNIHNILQGVADPEQRVSEEEKAAIIDWITDNAMRYWLTEDGPLRHPDEGGADIVVVDDPQMPGLIPFIKQSTPNRPVLYRSHIQIRSDLTAVPGSPQEDVWQYLWKNIQHADMFISHPIPEFVPGNVPRRKVAYMPATTDWLDGLNKPLNRWDTGYYGHSYNIQCHAHRMPELAWPARRYIAQVARFDPAKGVPTVVDAYAEFRRLYDEAGLSDPPQLCICGNGSVDDPDASMVFDRTMTQLETNYPHLIPDVSVMRLDHNDQLLNTILANAHVVLQLSTREGFEVKVSEALHAGRPVIATKAGGIPIQVKDGVDGFLVEPGDWRAVAAHLKQLFSDGDLHERMSREARAGVSDEVGTVGNALAWYYLAAKWAEVGTDPGLEGGEKWVNDMAREESGHLYAEGENRLPRHFTQKKA